MKLWWHVASAVPFVLVGSWEAALGCLLPDLMWVPNEVSIQRARRPAQETIDGFSVARLLPYRFAHSLLFWLACSALSPELALGAAVHVLLDLPTHRGTMQQRPLWPLAWRWPWTWFC
jgi:hypothetical protein